MGAPNRGSWPNATLSHVGAIRNVLVIALIVLAVVVRW
jgi:hypothetical protein